MGCSAARVQPPSAQAPTTAEFLSCMCKQPSQVIVTKPLFHELLNVYIQIHATYVKIQEQC